MRSNLQLNSRTGVSLLLCAVGAMWGCDDVEQSMMLTGGVMSGGVSTGGVMTGGVSTGGVMTGGVSTGGVMTGGASTGGVMTGGMMTGGVSMGGVSMGGMMTGGVMEGGTEGGMMTGGVMGGVEPEVGDPCVERQPDISMPCPVSIYEARNPARVALGRVVTLQGTVSAVRQTAQGTSHWVLQVHRESEGYRGVAYSGIWVYMTDVQVELDFEAQRGDLVELTGTLSDFYGQRQIKEVTSASFVGRSPNGIVAQVVEASEVSTNGLNADAYEGVLLRVEPASVIEVNPIAGPGDSDPNREFVLNGGLRVDDFLYGYRSLPEVGDTWAGVTGVLRLGNGDMKLVPRDVTDLGREDPPLDPSALVINEIDYDQVGGDNAEFIEIKNAGVMPASFVGVSLELVNGVEGSPNYRVIDLSPLGDIEPGELIVVGAESVIAGLDGGVRSLSLPVSLQNGPDGVRLTEVNLGVIDALGYEGLNLEEGSASVEDGEAPEQAGKSLARCGLDSDNNAQDFYLLLSSPGLDNPCE